MSSKRPIFRVLAYVLMPVAFTAVVTVLMLWLIGVFHPKVDGGRAIAAAPAGTPVGDARLAVVAMRSMPRSEAAVGTIRAVHETALASKLLARVLAVPVRAGMEVKRGDLLVQFDDEELQARLRRAEAGLQAAVARREQAQLYHDRVQNAFKERAATANELDNARTVLDAVVAEEAQAEQARLEAAKILSEAVIRSPIDGLVVDKQVEAGDTAVPGQVVVTLLDPTRMQLVATVRESLTDRLGVGQSVEVTIDALDKTCLGTVSEIVPEAETASRAFTVKVTGPCPAGVYSGMFGRLHVPLDDEQVLLVSAAAIRRIGQLDIVDVAEDGLLRRRAVELGRRFGDDVEVLAGLAPGEHVALAAQAAGGS